MIHRALGRTGRDGSGKHTKRCESKVEKAMEIKKIVITGGPCAGKTTGLSLIQNAFSLRGYRVLIVPETATELITGGVAPWTCGSNAEYQKCQVRLQIEKERIFERAASTMKDDRILIVCDRGALDNKAYMNDEEFAEVLADVGTNEVELRDQYNAVFHLVTAAKGAEKFYTKDNNTARYESVEEARALDERLIAAWTGHPHLRILDNSTSFGDKMNHLIAEIAAYLGGPEPFQLERKYLIEYPDVEELGRLPNCRKVMIEQTYLPSYNGEEIRIRQRGVDGHYIYTETKKKPISGLKRLSWERRLSSEEYLERLREADPDRRTIQKERYCLADGNQYFEIDIFPFWNDKAILEIELSDPEEEIRFPKMLKILREVTDDPAYKNAALAKSLPE